MPVMVPSGCPVTATALTLLVQVQTSSNGWHRAMNRTGQAGSSLTAKCKLWNCSAARQVIDGAQCSMHAAQWVLDGAQ